MDFLPVTVSINKSSSATFFKRSFSISPITPFTVPKWWEHLVSLLSFLSFLVVLLLRPEASQYQHVFSICARSGRKYDSYSYLYHYLCPSCPTWLALCAFFRMHWTPHKLPLLMQAVWVRSFLLAHQAIEHEFAQISFPSAFSWDRCILFQWVSWPPNLFHILSKASLNLCIQAIRNSPSCFNGLSFSSASFWCSNIVAPSIELHACKWVTRAASNTNSQSYFLICFVNIICYQSTLWKSRILRFWSLPIQDHSLWFGCHVSQYLDH